MQLSDNAKNYLLAAVIAVLGYLYTALAGFDNDIIYAKQDLDNMHEQLKYHLSDHEDRLRALEKFNCNQCD